MRDDVDCAITYGSIYKLNDAAQKLAKEMQVALDSAQRGEGLAAIGVLSSIEEDAKRLSTAIEGAMALQAVLNQR